MKRYVQIVDDYYALSVKTISVGDKSDKYIENIVAGLEINLDHDLYTVHVVTEDNKYEDY